MMVGRTQPVSMHRERSVSGDGWCFARLNTRKPYLPGHECRAAPPAPAVI